MAQTEIGVKPTELLSRVIDKLAQKLLSPTPFLNLVEDFSTFQLQSQQNQFGSDARVRATHHPQTPTQQLQIFLNKFTEKMISPLPFANLAADFSAFQLQPQQHQFPNPTQKTQAQQNQAIEFQPQITPSNEDNLSEQIPEREERFEPETNNSKSSQKIKDQEAEVSSEPDFTEQKERNDNTLQKRRQSGQTLTAQAQQQTQQKSEKQEKQEKVKNATEAITFKQDPYLKTAPLTNANILEPIEPELSSLEKKQPLMVQHKPQVNASVDKKVVAKQKPAEEKISRKQSSQDSFNMELTLKSKQTRNLSNTLGKADSLIYSDATFLQSNGIQFIGEPHPNPISKVQSHRSLLQKYSRKPVQKHQLNKIQRAVSRQLDRKSDVEDFQETIVDNFEPKAQIVHSGSKQQSENKIQIEQLEFDPRKNSQQQLSKRSQSESGVFQTEIKEYKSKIAKIRDLKEQKKKRLEAELKKINQEIQHLSLKEEHNTPQKGSVNNYQSRVKISDNQQARLKAQKLVKDLKIQKKSRQEAQINGLRAVDKNINNYMEQLMQERYKNQQRLKQRKKFEIIERMKQHELKKIEEQKRKDKNIEFISHLKTSNNNRNAEHNNRESLPQSQPQQSVLSDPKSANPKVDMEPNKQKKVLGKERSATKASEKLQAQFEPELTPELSRKKDYLKKVRNIRFKKERVDQYEQSLM